MHKLFFNTLIITLVLSLTYFSSSSFGLTPQEMDAEYEKVKLAAQNQNWHLAKTIATPLAEKGHAKSQVAMGNFYLKGLGVSENGKEALKWYTLAAKQGQVLAQYTVGVIYASGEIIPENFPEAKRWLELAAKQGEAKANQFLVRLKKEEQRRKSPTGLGIFEDNDRVLQERMKRLAEQKKRRAEEERLAEEKRRTDEKQRAEEKRLAKEKRLEEERVSREKRIAAEEKRLSEEKRLVGISGGELQDGLDAYKKKDHEKALAILEPLGWKGITEAQFILGQIYHGKNDWKQSFMWHLVAAKKGHAISQRNLGYTYFDGKGVKEDVIMALGWYKQAVKNGDPKAQGYLNGMERTFSHFTLEERLLKGGEQRVKEAKDHEQRVIEDFKEQGPKRIADLKAAEEQRIADLKAAEEQRIAEVEEVKRKASEEKRLLEKVKSGKSGDQQVKFIEVVSSAIVKYKKAKNEIKKSIIRKKRAEALESLFGLNHDDFTYRKPTFDERQSALSECTANLEDSIGVAINLGIDFNMQREIKRCEDSSKISVRVNVAGISNKSLFWNGVIKSLDTDKNGNATVILELHDNILIKNATNSITPHSPIYEVLGEFEEGEKVIFNGSFVLHDNKNTTGYFLKTTNITEKGSLTDPEFDFTFTDFMK